MAPNAHALNTIALHQAKAHARNTPNPNHLDLYVFIIAVYGLEVLSAYPNTSRQS